MSDEREKLEANQASTPPSAGSTSEPQAAAPAGAEALDAVEDIDFLLEEIESKIAPLALA